jgi:hypothetical protein
MSLHAVEGECVRHETGRIPQANREDGSIRIELARDSESRAASSETLSRGRRQLQARLEL